MGMGLGNVHFKNAQENDRLSFFAELELERSPQNVEKKKFINYFNISIISRVGTYYERNYYLLVLIATPEEELLLQHYKGIQKVTRITLFQHFSNIIHILIHPVKVRKGSLLVLPII